MLPNRPRSNMPYSKRTMLHFHRKQKIQEKGGDFYFPNVTDTETKKERIQILMLTRDFDGSLGKWGNDWKNLESQKLKNKQCNIKLNKGPHILLDLIAPRGYPTRCNITFGLSRTRGGKPAS